MSKLNEKIPSFVDEYKAFYTETEKETIIKNKIKKIFNEEVGIKDDGSDVFSSMIQFIYECIEEDKFISIEFTTQEMKDSINKAVMKVILMDKENDNPDDFTILCRFISKSFSEKSVDDEKKENEESIN